MGGARTSCDRGRRNTGELSARRGASILRATQRPAGPGPGAEPIFTAPPREREWQSWLAVALLSGLIFVVVFFVRTMQALIAEAWGRGAVTWIVAGAGLVLLLAVLAWYRRYPGRSLSGLAVLLAAGALCGYLIADLRGGSPEEAVHYLLYGALGLLLYRAFAHRVRDRGIYGLAILAGSIVGLLDEAIQWAVPGRYFDFRDIWLNLTGIALVQVAIALGIRPAIIRGWPAARSLGLICWTGAGLAGLLALCHLNTPAAVTAYARALPGLGFLLGQDDPMVEYGHLHRDPAYGSFKSRLSAAELEAADQARGAGNARILDAYAGAEGFYAFLAEYPGHTHPALHEAMVHIRSRDVNLALARRATDPEEAGQRYTFAHLEHLILARYFPVLYAATRQGWTGEEAAEIAARAVPGLTRQSLVSRHLITVYGQRQAVWVLGLLAVLLTAAGVLMRRRAGT